MTHIKDIRFHAVENGEEEVSHVGALHFLNSVIQFVPINKCYSSGGDGGLLVFI